ncbi:MAG: copper homeostasis protein CutC [Solobacterium sp.]|nr:copper homeostasis protein CutC [Solobacterium sp.]
MIRGITTELCAGSIRDCLLAERFPIDRIELNCALELDGLTPSFHEFMSARRRSTKKIICMVRPRAAGFVYRAEEIRTMFDDAETFLENKADGIVFGFLNPNDTIDKALVRDMAELVHSYQKEAVFHMAFDLTPDPFEAIETLIGCGIDRVLTKGHAANAVEGIPLLANLIALYGQDIQILPGGGVSGDNVKDIIRQSGACQIHFSAKSAYDDHGTYYACDERKITAILDSLKTV